MADHKLSESAERSVAVYIDGIVAAAKEAERAKLLGVVHRCALGYKREGEWSDGDQMSLNERLAAAYALDLVADDMRRDSATPAPAHTSALTDAADWLETSMGDWSLLPEWRDHLRVLIAAARERGE